MQHKKQTILLCGTRQSDLYEAEQLIPSIKKHQPAAEIILYTNFKDYKNDNIDEIVIIENPYYGYADKIYAMSTLPRKEFLFLDNDTFLIGNIDELFTITEKFDIAVAHAPNRWTFKLNNIPDSYPEFNTGVILIKRSEKINVFLSDWLTFYLQQIKDQLQILSGDQPSFREILYGSDLRVATLTPEYNCRFTMGCLVSHRVKILHGRILNFEYVKDRINLGPINDWNNEPSIRFIKYDYNDPEKKLDSSNSAKQVQFSIKKLFTSLFK